MMQVDIRTEPQRSVDRTKYKEAYRWIQYRAQKFPGIVFQATLEDRILTGELVGSQVIFRSYWRT